MMQTAMQRGLPSNLDAERLVVGSILLDNRQYDAVAGALTADDKIR
jgi:replicative DNA helicase